ncbi:sugar ABC transporter permease [Pseudonocardia alaniniphila]|uniref:Sugar ABC transporter permease n=1 Tax=Pseudonocardia alaniniphila TaxID=75291 RepID=A0ABS9TAC4_9PSEU|nr:sugar ABC transporter permease [Pseudonocardia alaniniphila]MCH6165368.1 sugar ABC transporter permease [Pseudonocardia alaniniphila]
MTVSTASAPVPAAARVPAPAPRPRRTGANGLLALPALVFFVVFALVPLAGAVVLSFADWDGLGELGWAGWSNWAGVLTDPVTGQALLLTVKIMVVSWLVQTPISLLLGVFTAGTQRYRAVLAVLYFVPLLLSSAAVAIAFKAILDPNFGIGGAPGLGFLAQDWLGDPDLVLYVVIFVIAWQFVPFHTLLYQAGVRQIPTSLYEAATIDGAGMLAQFRHITLPQLRYTIVTSSTLMLTGSLTYFDVVFVLTGGGPGTSTRLLPLDMYLTGFSANDMGGASVLAVILVVAGLGLAFVLTRFSGFARMSSEQEGL